MAKLPLFNLFLLIGLPFINVNAQALPSAEYVIEATCRKLNEINTLQYDYRRIVNYSSSRKYNELNGVTFFDFASHDSVMNAKFYFISKEYLIAFNGIQSIYLDNDQSTVSVENSPLRSNLAQLSFLNHSIYSLRFALPWIILDKSKELSLSDTSINNVSYYHLKFSLKNTSIHSDGRRWPLSDGIKINYSILVDKSSLIPVQIKQTNYESGDGITTIFSNIKENCGYDDNKTNILSVSTYNKYQHNTGPVFGRTFFKSSYSTIEFRLPNIRDTRDTISLKRFSRKYVLLDFWIINCGPCIQSIPTLHSFNKEFDPEKIKILSVNPLDSPEEIRNFMKNQPLMDYDIVFNAKQVAAKYGISFYPTIVILDPERKVVYNGQFDLTSIKSTLPFSGVKNIK